MTGRVVVVGIGNAWRHDDGAGLEAARRAGARLGDAVHTFELDGEPARLVEAWDGASLAVLVDAVSSGAAPGTLHRITIASDRDRPLRGATGSSSHALGPAAAYRLGQALDRLPGALIVLGIEVGDVTTGVGLSPTVAAAVEDAVEAVVTAVRSTCAVRSS